MFNKQKRRIYHSRNPIKLIILILLAIIVLFIIFAASVFFSFKKYLVYTPNGVELEIPWLDETAHSNTQAALLQIE